MTDQPKFCKDCRWCERPITENSHCTHLKSTIRRASLNVVTGEKIPEIYQFAYDCRNTGICGPDAKLFEPKP